jgi:hypothetical protein
METQNVTLSVRKDILRKAKLIAVRRGTSLSRLLTEALETMVNEEDGYEQARRRQLELMRRGLDLGTYGKPPASRNELHER